MQKHVILPAILLMFLFSACHQQENISGRIWFFTHSTESLSRELPDSTLSAASFFDLEEDGTYSSDFGNFDYGRWAYNNHQIIFTSYSKNKSIILVNYINGNEIQAGPKAGPFNNFESQPISFRSVIENPFLKENNLWRIKAIAKETPAQLKERLRNHFRYWELYFTWALNNNIQYIDVRSTPTPVKIYGNGFTLKPFKELPAAWKKYFYDDEDCQAANEKIKQLIESNSIAFPHTENKYKTFISLFQQLQKIQ